MLAIEEVRRLSEISVGRAQGRALCEWLVVISLTTLQVRFLPWWTYPLTTLLIASRQHAILVLMHDAAHFRAAHSRFWNDVFGEALAWPLFVSMRAYRRHHNKHHVMEALNTPTDPDFERKMRRAKDDWTFPMPKQRLARLLVRDVLLLNLHEYVWEAQDARNLEPIAGSGRTYAISRWVFTLSLLAALTLFGGWRLFLLYWILPLLTWLKAILRMRSLADHFAVPNGPSVLSRTRTIIAPVWERILIAPAAISVHGPHHAFASIPYYRLRHAHDALLKLPEYRDTAVISPSYWHTAMNELCP